MSGEGGGGGSGEMGVGFVEGDTWCEYSRGVFEMDEFITDGRGNRESALLVAALHQGSWADIKWFRYLIDLF
jgi:hypothetical protein